MSAVDYLLTCYICTIYILVNESDVLAYIQGYFDKLQENYWMVFAKKCLKLVGIFKMHPYTAFESFQWLS